MNHTLIQLQENIQLDVSNACASVAAAIVKSKNDTEKSN